MGDLENCGGETTITPSVNFELIRDHRGPSTSAENVSGLAVNVTLGLPLSDQKVLIVLYTLTTALSVVGNVLAIIVFTAGRRSRTDLRLFLINLAVADLVMAVFCMPFTFTVTMLGHWVFSAPMCPVVLFLQTVSVTASVFTSVAVGIDRYWVVNFPLRSRITKSRSPAVITAIWSAACTFSSIQLIVGRASGVTLPTGQQVTRTLVFSPSYYVDTIAQVLLFNSHLCQDDL